MPERHRLLRELRDSLASETSMMPSAKLAGAHGIVVFSMQQANAFVLVFGTYSFPFKAKYNSINIVFFSTYDFHKFHIG